MFFTKLSLIVLVTCSSLAAFAQQPDEQLSDLETHLAFRAFALQVADAGNTLSETDKTWLTQLIDDACVCVEKKGEAKNECYTDVFSSFGLPENGVKPDDLTEEQMNKIMLLFSLSEVMGKCPEHKRNL